MNHRLNRKPLLLAALLAPAFFPALPLGAQNASDGTLHVLRPSINAEQEAAELCLEFDHAIDLSDRNKIISDIHLQRDGKTEPVPALNVNLSSNSLCVQSLVHRDEYSLSVANLRGAGGEKLNEPYRITFTVPDRRPSLAFSGDVGGESLPRYRDNDPTLHAVNVTHVQISLYRVTDPARMAEAYGKRMQTTLAPSESLTYAKTNGKLVWQSEEVFDNDDDRQNTNRNLERVVPLHAIPAAAAPGLYFLIAADANAAAREPAEDTDKSDDAEKADSADLAPLAAQWFVRSDLKLRTIFRQDGITGETENVGNGTVAPGAHVTVYNSDTTVLAEGTSDANGQAALTLPADKINAAATIVALTPSGDVDFADAATEKIAAGRFRLSGLEAGMAADKPFYMPGAMATLSLTARDIHGAAVETPGSHIQILRPDHEVYASLPVPDGKAGQSFVSFPAPPFSGAGDIMWFRTDGQKLAELPLRVSANAAAPSMTVSADRPQLNYDGDLNLALKSVTADGKPAPYIAGQVMVQWREPETLDTFAGYHFGGGDKIAGPMEPAAAFITDGAGNANLRINLKAPDDSAPLHTAILNLVTDPVQGVLDPGPLSLPVKPVNLVVGIKPLAPDGKFSENSDARFDVIAIAGDGKRHEDTGLKFQVYEEGRSFAWYQDEGRWNYKPQQQHRRIGGGSLDIKTGGTTLHWPVTSGSYLIEVTDVNGVVLARCPFDAGWDFLKMAVSRPDDLALSTEAQSMQPGIPATVKFTLAHPAVVTTVIADDHIRMILHEARKEGANTVSFTPAEDWGRHIRVRIEASESGSAALHTGQIELDVAHRPKELGVAIEAPARIMGGEELGLTANIGNIDAGKAAFANFLATPQPRMGDEALGSILAPQVPVDNNGKAFVRIAVPRFDGTLHLTALVSNQTQSGRADLAIQAGAAIESRFDLPSFMAPQDNLQATLSLANRDGPAGSYRYIFTPGPGLKLSGIIDAKIGLKPGAAASADIGVTAAASGAHDLMLDIFGPRDLHVNRRWEMIVAPVRTALVFEPQTEIAPQKSWSPEAATRTKNKTAEDSRLVVVGQRPLFGAPALLPAFLEQAPFTTGAITDWLETARVWRDIIAAADLMPAALLQSRADDLLKRLLARQNADGSFPALASGEGDAAATAEALVTLAHNDAPAVKPAIDAAAGWLQNHLSNTWFGEDERPLRAAGFAALAAVDRLDVSALRYFAETSNDKSLPPLAMAQLAAALAKSNDRDKAYLWLTRLRDHLTEDTRLLPATVENPLVETRDIFAALEKTGADLVQHPARDPRATAEFLRAVWIVHARAGGWRLSVNGTDRDENAIAVLVSSEKAPLTLRNPLDHPLEAVAGEKMASSPPAGANVITRRFYKPDGSEIAPGQFASGGIYLVRLDGTYPAEKSAARELELHDDPGAGLRPLGCFLDGDAANADAWTWLRGFSLNPVVGCEAGRSGLTALLDEPDDKNGKSWHAAYFVETPMAGSFAVPAPAARLLNGQSALAGADMRIAIGR